MYLFQIVPMLVAALSHFSCDSRNGITSQTCMCRSYMAKSKVLGPR